jgi:spore coat polysaccharide biosynthesis protein SpsF
MTASFPVLFRCDADLDIGLGHASRCAAIAEALQSLSGCSVSFAVQRGALGREWLERKGYKVHGPASQTGAGTDSWFLELTKALQPHVVVVDVRDDLACEVLSSLKERGIQLAILDDASDRRWLADEIFYPVVGGTLQLDWTGFKGVVHSGWEWVVLHPEFATRPPRVERKIPNLLVSMGGTDPAGLTPFVLHALRSVESDFHLRVVMGPGAPWRNDVDGVLAELGQDVEVLENPVRMAPIMAETDLALASFGVTAFELAAQGVPAIYLCLTDDHFRSAELIVAERIAVNLGVYTEVPRDLVTQTVTQLLQDSDGRLGMRQRAERLLDGRGAARIADRILELGTRANG